MAKNEIGKQVTDLINTSRKGRKSLKGGIYI